ncbi:hypothetical protein MKJ01_05685 [Chryseobacterium sp. SSA4.19]|uniref:hypothetical protein n=1 Tax=Chryseobacterium sp. SSA4.19 TaxID=2919915 RepID=UPI001F4D98B7|nr:hypothetical protein [Chryseobacterium sp. SSA4.19]MCJ8153252.1 hypothetical protein [Chryseobacterium sp. SSA4.19]
MNEVKYLINYKDFRDFRVYVSDSIGITDGLERKPVQSYDWAEYHGTSPSLTKPRYKERKIELKCFIDGENWEVMVINFNSFKDQFTRSGTQRIHIVPFEHTVLPYEIYIQEEISLEKTFRKGRMVGIFSLKLIEPNPIKKVLKTSLDSFILKYNSKSETEIFPGDGTKLTGRGNVNFLFQYSEPNYQASGISLVQNSAVNNEYYEVYTIPAAQNTYQFSVNITLASPKNVTLYVIGRKPDNTYNSIKSSSIFEAGTGINSVSLTAELDMSQYTKFFYKVLDSDGQEIPGIIYTLPKIETAEVIGNWQNMLGKEKIIIIAGDIDKVTILETPAEVIWEKI